MMLNRRALPACAALLLLVNHRMDAQSWMRRYDAFQQEETQFGWSVEHDGDSGYVVFCFTTYQDSVLYGPVVGAAHLNGDGLVSAEHVSWVTGKYCYPGWSNTSDRTMDGGFVVGGSSDEGGDTIRVCVYRFAAGGQPAGIHELNLPGVAWIGRQAKQTLDGGFLICGETSATGTLDAFLVKTDSLFQVQWVQTYGSPNRRDLALAVALAPNGGYYLGGKKEITFNNFDQWVLRLDENGNQIWQATYGVAGNNDVPNAHLEALADGNCVFASAWNLTGNGEHTLCLVKIDTAGGVLWSHTYGGWCGGCSLFAVKEITPGGDLISCGQAWSIADDGEQGVLLRTTAQGDSVWQRNFFYADSLMSDGQGTLRDVLPTTDGGFIAVGMVYSSASGNNPPGYGQDLWVVKVDSMGCLEPGCHLITGLTSQVTNLRGALRVWPNPVQVQGQVQVTWDLPEAVTGSAQLTLVSAAGHVMGNWPVALAERGQSLDLGGYAAGLYHVHLVVEGRWVSGARVVVQ